MDSSVGQNLHKSLIELSALACRTTEVWQFIELWVDPILVSTEISNASG